MFTRWTALALTAIAVILTTSPADAQMRFTTTGGFTTNGRFFAGPTFATNNRFFVGPTTFGGTTFGGFGGPTWTGTWGHPGFWPGWNNPWNTSFSGWTVYPGIFSVSTEPAPRARVTMAPAVAVPADVLLPRYTTARPADALYTPSTSKYTPGVTSGVREASYTSESGQVSGRRAAIHVNVPAANAELWFDGVRVTQQGAQSEYLTPPLEGAGKYAYEVRVRWTDATGRPHEVTQNLSFNAGDRVRVTIAEPVEQLPQPKVKD